MKTQAEWDAAVLKYIRYELAKGGFIGAGDPRKPTLVRDGDVLDCNLWITGPKQNHEVRKAFLKRKSKWIVR